MHNREDQTRSGPGFNRRDFLKGSGAAVAATTLATGNTESEAAVAQTAKVVAGVTNVKLNVNGKDYTLKLD